MNVYPDTSFLVALYLPDAHSPSADQHMTENPRLLVTTLHRAECAHAFFLQVFQRRISVAEAGHAHKTFERDCGTNVWFQADFPPTIFDLAVELGKEHAGRIGCRTLDTLHVASALELLAERFWTFDERQARLARAVGLRVR